MKLYLLLEGKRSEAKIYPAWLQALPNPFIRTYRLDQIAPDEIRSFYSISADGYPSIIGQHLKNSIADVLSYPHFDWLIVALDVDESTEVERIYEVESACEEYGLQKSRTKLFVVPQMRCIETWLLGNKRVVGRSSSYTHELLRFYDVIREDPERMAHPRSWKNHAHFHFHYLNEVFKSKGISYSKRNPGEAAEPHYFEALVRRIESSPGHLGSFERFHSFITNV